MFAIALYVGSIIILGRTQPLAAIFASVLSCIFSDLPAKNNTLRLPYTT